MKILNEFDAVRYGTYTEFKSFYSGDVNVMNKYVNLNLLSLSMVNDINEEEKLKIINFLISEGIDVNFQDSKFKRNALHWFYFSNFRPSVKYMLEITKLLVENGLNINAVDKYGAIPFRYALTTNKLPTIELKSVYEYLLEKGSDYNIKDIFGKSCIDYMKEFSWRNDALDTIKEFENGNKK